MKQRKRMSALALALGSLVALAALTFGAGKTTQAAADEAGLRVTMNGAVAAWNAGDAKAFLLLDG